MTTRLYGWFDDPTQDTPSYDPKTDAPFCLYCGGGLAADNVRTHSIMMEDGEYAKRSYFYRTHRDCDDAAKARGKHLDNAVFEMIDANGD